MRWYDPQSGCTYDGPLFKDAVFACENCQGITEVEEQSWVRGLRVCADCADTAPDADVIQLDQHRRRTSRAD